MTWNPRDTRRWGSRQTIAAVPTIAATILETEELCRAEGPAPATWNLVGQVEGVPAADQVGMLWFVLLTLGVGATSTTLVLPFNPALPWTAVLVPAQWVSVQVRATGPIVTGGAWRFTAMAAPSTQWEGTVVTPDGD